MYNGHAAKTQKQVQLKYVAAVAKWSRYWTRGWCVRSSSPVPLKTHRVGGLQSLSRAETSCCLRCYPCHLTMVQNYEVSRQKPLCT
ncbi:hypothetical protein TNCV_2265921 [Trichonephila clavipes]|nr:hypothetical protein TNCV_2265921 [Trichonephila clavipes]